MDIFRIFNDFTRDRFRDIEEDFNHAFEEVRTSQWRPPVDVLRSSDKVFVTADLAGLSKEEINLEVLSNNSLRISGNRPCIQEPKKNDFFSYHLERGCGQFQRLIPLPKDAMTDNIQASFKNGVLEIQIPTTGKPAKNVNVQIN